MSDIDCFKSMIESKFNDADMAIKGRFESIDSKIKSIHDSLYALRRNISDVQDTLATRREALIGLKPYKCPVCKGSGWNDSIDRNCISCDEKGIVWG